MRRVNANALVLVLLALWALGTAVEAQVSLNVDMELSQPRVALDVSPGSVGLNETDLILWNNGSCRLDLSFSLENGHMLTGLRPHMAMGAHSAVVIPLHLWAPPGTLAQEIDYTIHSRSRDCSGLRLPNQVTDSVTGQVEVLHYRLFDVQAGSERVEVGSPSNQLINFTIYNAGNGADTFAIALQDAESLEDRGMSWSGPGNVTVDAASARFTGISLNTRDMEAGSHRMVIVITDGAGTADTVEVEIVVPTWAGAIRNQISTTIEDSTAHRGLMWIAGAILSFLVWFFYRLWVT